LPPGPTCQPRRTASLAPHRPPLFASPRPPRARAVASDRAARSHFSAAVRLPTPRCTPLSPSTAWPARADPSPIFPLCCSLCAHRFGEDAGASLRSVPHPLPSSSSPPSPPPTRPPHRLPPPETPPPLWFPPEHRHRLSLSVNTTVHSLSIQMDSPLTFSLLP
jgi:hypothetical protein